MRITLIYPLLSRRRASVDENKQFWPPLGLAYLASVLEDAGHSVQIIDRDIVLRQNSLDFGKTDLIMIDRIGQFRSDMVGISATTPNMPDVDHISGVIKKNRDIPIVLGGTHATGEPELSIEELKNVDLVARGEGENIVVSLANGLNWQDINGLTFRKGADIISTPDAEPISDLDKLPLPARHLLEMSYYTRPSRFTSRNLSLRTTSIFTARGCPYRCNFCAGPLIFNGKVRYHSPERVVKEAEELADRYAVEALYFAEDMFLSNKKRAEEVLNLFIQKGLDKRLRWVAQAKASVITEDLLAFMKRSGCIGVEYGFESGSQRVLDLMNKKMKVEESVRAASLAKKAGMRFQANIIVGYPGEKPEDFNMTIKLIKKTRPNMIGFNIFMPLPGTQSYRDLKAAGRELPDWQDVGDQEKTQVNYADMGEGVFEKMYLRARFTTILPINFYNFVKDNIANPARLFSVLTTQFGGIMVKTMRAFPAMLGVKRRKTRVVSRMNILFLSYNGLLEPILPSQGLSYMKELSKKGASFVLLTYEKEKDLRKAGRNGIKDLKESLKKEGIEWHILRYHKYPPIISTVFDLTMGVLWSYFLMIANNIRVVHVRGVTPGFIALALSHIRKIKIIFDMRGFLAEEYAAGGIWKEGSVIYNMVKRLEKSLLKRADAVTVLTNKHYEFNGASGSVKPGSKPMEVVPCCVDLGRFKPDAAEAKRIRKETGIGSRFVFMYPGKIGTFYLMDEMMEFFKCAKALIPESLFLVLTKDAKELIAASAKDHGIDPQDIRIMTAEFDEMPKYLNLADAGIFFINPYKKTGSSPIKMGEFLSSGIPVIINPGVGDTEEIVRSNRVGVVVDKFDSEHYVRGVKEITDLLAGDGGLKERCRDTARSYLSLEEGVNKYYKIYESLIKV
ncbi:MAG: radical SAM protein [Candidatus Omnitrophica bacterium]|nr:radical SAM protein [Candidatus Omnitrophota bacterium]